MAMLNFIQQRSTIISNMIITLFHHCIFASIFSACYGAVRGDVISVLQGKTTSRLVYILPGMFIFQTPYKRNS